MAKKPRKYTTEYCVWLQEVVPWLKKELPKDKELIDGVLKDAVQESVEGAHDATVCLCFAVLESYLDEYPNFSDKIIALLAGLSGDDDCIFLDISW